MVGIVGFGCGKRLLRFNNIEQNQRSGSENRSDDFGKGIVV